MTSDFSSSPTRREAFLRTGARSVHTNVRSPVADRPIELCSYGRSPSVRQASSERSDGATTHMPRSGEPNDHVAHGLLHRTGFDAELTPGARCIDPHVPRRRPEPFGIGGVVPRKRTLQN